MKYNPYSISKLGVYNTCPLQFKLKYIDKINIPFVSNIALLRGSFIHKVIEEAYDYNVEFEVNEIFTEEEKQKVIKVIKKFEESEIGQKYKKIAEAEMLNPIQEEKFGLKIENSSVKICSYDDHDAWLRGAIDFQYKYKNTAYNIDWKSGKSKVNDKDFGITQSTAYSIFLFLKYPDIEKVISRFVFVEHNVEKEIIYTRDKFVDYVKLFYNKVKVIESDENFKENISALCAFCDYNIHGICTKPKELEEKSKDFMTSKISFDF